MHLLKCSSHIPISQHVSYTHFNSHFWYSCHNLHILKNTWEEPPGIFHYYPTMSDSVWSDLWILHSNFHSSKSRKQPYSTDSNGPHQAQYIKCINTVLLVYLLWFYASIARSLSCFCSLLCAWVRYVTKNGILSSKVKLNEQSYVFSFFFFNYSQLQMFSMCDWKQKKQNKTKEGAVV